jgi:hypothetical protein
MEANGPSVDRRWRHGQEAKAPAACNDQPEDMRDAARGGGATRGGGAGGQKAVAL